MKPIINGCGGEVNNGRATLNRRDRDGRRRPSVSLKGWASQAPPDFAALRIYALEDWAPDHPDDPLGNLARLSGRDQRGNGNMVVQAGGLDVTACQAGCPVIGRFEEVACGRYADRPVLWEAVKCCLRHDAALHLRDLTRLRRHPDYTTRNPIQVAAEHLHEVRAVYGWDFDIVLDVPPAATLEEIADYHREQGQQAKGDRGGGVEKPKTAYKKPERDEVLGLVLRLAKKGKTAGQIARRVKCERNTVLSWLRRYQNEA